MFAEILAESFGQQAINRRRNQSGRRSCEINRDRVQEFAHAVDNVAKIALELNRGQQLELRQVVHI